MTNKPEPSDTNIDERIEAALKSTHRVGSHSDDYGGTSDFPCYCTAKAQLKQLLVEARIDEAQLQYDLARAAHSKGHILTHQEERLAALQGEE